MTSFPKRLSFSSVAFALLASWANPLTAATVLTNGVLASSVTASGSYLGNVPINAFDDNPGSIWLAGSFPLAWIEIDLGSTYLVNEGYFSVNMSPDGAATHQIWISNNPILGNTGGATLAHTFTANFGGQIITPSFTGVEGRYVQIRTVSSPSWVSWFEVELLSVPEPSGFLLVGLAGLYFSASRRRR